MLPLLNSDLRSFKMQTQSTKTYRLNVTTQTIVGMVDSLAAMEQAVYLILSTQRYRYLIYSWNYGVELMDLFGQPKDFVYSELKRRITEALKQDRRIESVSNFTFSNDRGKIKAMFNVHTTQGDIAIERVVSG